MPPGRPATDFEAPPESPASTVEPGLDAPPPAPAARAVVPTVASEAGDDGDPEVGGTAAPPADWLDRVCPYLLSEDGTWRSTEPDAGHRCMAQEPPAEVTMLFQERFCLSDRHVRCEWFKVAQSGRVATLEEEGIEPDQVRSARFRPSVRSVPLAVGPADGESVAHPRRSPPRALLIALAVGGGFAIIVALALIFANPDGDGPGVVDGSPPATLVATIAPTPAVTPTPTPDPVVGSSPAATVAPSVAAGPILIRYEVQPGERLERIGERFGIRRRRILRANPGLQDSQPLVETGQLILVPVPATMPLEDITSEPGFVEFVEES